MPCAAYGATCGCAVERIVIVAADQGVVGARKGADSVEGAVVRPGVKEGGKRRSQEERGLFRGLELRLRR